MNQSIKNRHTIKGFTLLELMISLSVGLVLFAGVMSIFVGMRTTTAETSSYGEMQENGRFAISVLTDDLLKQNFWGDYAGTFSSTGISPIPAAPTNECVGAGVNNGTFPAAIGAFRTLWGQTVTVANPMGCFNDARIGSDILQLKRVVASPIGPGNPVVNTTVNNFYLVSNMTSGTIFTGVAVPAIDNSHTSTMYIMFEMKHKLVRL